MDITLSYSDLQLQAGREDWEKVVETVLAKAAEIHQIDEQAEISVLLCDDEYIHALNREYRNIDRPTDVLSFALNEGEQSAVEEMGMLGDIIVSVDKVVEQAAEYGHSEKRELAYLTVHGFLHIIGYDHMTDEEKEEMRAAEEEVLQALAIGRE